MDELKPEERARVKIDEQLVDAGWHIASRGGNFATCKLTEPSVSLPQGAANYRPQLVGDKGAWHNVRCWHDEFGQEQLRESWWRAVAARADGAGGRSGAPVYRSNCLSNRITILDLLRATCGS